MAQERIAGFAPLARRRRARAALGFLVVVAAVAAGCGPPAAQVALLNDPREILTKGVTSSVALRSVHIRAELTMRNAAIGQPMPVVQSAALDADLDFASGNLAATGAMQGGGGERFGLIVLDGSTFIQSAPNGRWQQMPKVPGGGLAGLAMFGMPGMQPPNVGALLLKAAAEPRLAPQLVAVEPCDTGQCYRLAITIAPDLLWDLLVDALGLGQMGLAAPGEMPPGIPPLSLEVSFDTATLLLVETRLAISADGTDLSALVLLSGHDRAIAIQPPPPGLVDPMPGFGGGF